MRWLAAMASLSSQKDAIDGGACWSSFCSKKKSYGSSYRERFPDINISSIYTRYIYISGKYVYISGIYVNKKSWLLKDSRDLGDYTSRVRINSILMEFFENFWLHWWVPEGRNMSATSNMKKHCIKTKQKLSNYYKSVKNHN